MEARNRYQFKQDPFAGSFVFGTSSPGDDQMTSPALNRSSPLVSSLTSSPAVRRRYQADHISQTGGSSTVSKVRRPPLSSVLDGVQINSPQPGQYQHENQQQWFGNSPTPRKTHFESSAAMSVEDPFQRSSVSFTARELGESSSSSSFLYGASANQFSSPNFQHGRSGIRRSLLDEAAEELVVTPAPTGAVSSSSPAATLGQFAPAVDRAEAVWNSWVVVYGYQVQPGINLNAALLERFKEYGVIERFSPSNGNWIFIKYESPIQAERAANQNGTFFNSNNLLAVTRMSPRIAKYMNLSLHRDGSLTAGEVDVTVPFTTGEANDSGSAQNSSLLLQHNQLETRGKYQVSRSSRGGQGAVDDSDLYLRPYRSKSICTKIVEYFFSY